MHQPISRKVELYKPRNGEAGTETCRVVKPSSVKTKERPSPCGFTYGIAVYGPVCTVVWEWRAGNRSPYPDSARFISGPDFRLRENAIWHAGARPGLKAGEESKRLNRHDSSHALAQSF